MSNADDVPRDADVGTSQALLCLLRTKLNGGEWGAAGREGMMVGG